MLEGALELDYSGIIALEKETEAEYIRRGKNVLRKADEIKRDGIFEYSSTLYYVKPKKQMKFPAEVSGSMEKQFGVSPSWIPVYKMGIQWGTSGYCGEVRSGGSRVPVIFFQRFLFNGYSTIQHEAIHAVRTFVSYSRFSGFEEAMADYLDMGFFKKFKPSLAIRKAKKKLEDRFGEKAGHILIRLLPPEIYGIASSKEPERLLKEWGCLKHRIIRERMGL